MNLYEKTANGDFKKTTLKAGDRIRFGESFVSFMRPSSSEKNNAIKTLFINGARFLSAPVRRRHVCSNVLFYLLSETERWHVANLIARLHGLYVKKLNIDTFQFVKDSVDPFAEKDLKNKKTKK